MRTTTSLPLMFAAVTLAGCTNGDTITVGPGDVTKAGDGKFDSSVEAVIVDFEFDGELFSDFAFNPTQQVKDQLMFTMGQLNGSRGVARLDLLQITNVQTGSLNGKTHVTYHAKVPVAWGRRNNVPSSYELILPADMSFSAQQAFFDKYKSTCVEGEISEIEWSSSEVLMSRSSTSLRTRSGLHSATHSRASIPEDRRTT